jgi:hypothetical protein
MKYQIDTIPVWDAIKEDCECPFCHLQEQIEAKQLDYYLGDSVMQSHIRIRTNETGFCARHYEMMLKNDRKLSLGLMGETHARHILKETEGALETLAKGELPSKKQTKTLSDMLKKLNDINEKCVVCEDIEYDIMRYLHTYVYLFKKDPALKEAMQNSKGFCLNHFSMLLEVADKKLSGKHLSEFLSIAATVQKANMERLIDEVKWFCDKFDYRNSDKPWGNSKDSLPRMLTKLGGKMQK